MMEDGFKQFGRKDDGIDVLIDIRTCGLKLREVMKVIEDYKQAHPDRVVWMDGDLYAVVSRAEGAGA